MALLRWIPYKDLLFLQERMSRIFDEALARYGGDQEGARSSWMPPADMYETDNSIVLKVELAGVDKEDVDIEVEDGTLILKGERKSRNLDDEHYHRMELSYGSFYRVFSLPSATDKDAIKANFSSGVLEVTIPKAPGPVSKHIEVEIK